ncbi:MAG TPA: hypothetical protein VN213_15920, partial [Solirubrobacteraceae bacterium]|nr:hypothetical protein [Solirubrobacteraceae bacterium]
HRLDAAIDLTVRGVILPGTPQDYRVARTRPWWPALRAVTARVRMWADWPTLQPDPAFDVGDPASPGHHSLLALDEQIRAAERDGLAVFLLPYRYPPWANGTAELQPASAADLAHMLADRARPGAIRRADGGPPAGLKAREYALPADGHGPDSPWGRFVSALLDRYVARGEEHGRIQALEVVNEPNLQLWPQRSPAAAASPFDDDGTELVAHRAVAEMMVTVDELVTAAGGGLTCLAPSVADAETYPRLVSGVRDGFAEALLDELDRRGFGGGCHWRWSYHNYGDMEQGTDGVVDLRRRIAGRWRGLERDGGPVMAATEGGCRLSAMGEGLSDEARLREQAVRLARAVDRHRDLADLGAGLEFLTQYTVMADPNYDCGLRGADGTERPAFGAWCTALA